MVLNSPGEDPQRPAGLLGESAADARKGKKSSPTKRGVLREIRRQMQPSHPGRAAGDKGGGWGQL